MENEEFRGLYLLNRKIEKRIEEERAIIEENKNKANNWLAVKSRHCINALEWVLQTQEEK